MHKVLILGAGKIGALISGLLAESGDYDVTLGDVNSAAAESVVKAHGSRSLRAVALDAGDGKALASFVMTGGFGSSERKDSANDNVMPEFRQLSDEDLAAILTFIRQKFGGGASGVTASDVAEARAALPAGS